MTDKQNPYDMVGDYSDDVEDVLKDSQSKDNSAAVDDIDRAIKQAASDGGYRGVLDHHDKHDPDEASTLRQKKNDLDENIKQTLGIRFESRDKQSGVMEKSLDLMANFALPILNAPKEEQEDMYRKIHPTLKSMVGDAAPETYGEEAKDLLMLAYGQAVPASKALTLTDTVADYSNQREDLLESGMDPDHPSITALDKELVNTAEKLAEIETKKLDIKLDQFEKHDSSTKARFKMEDTLRKEYLSLNKDFMKVRDAFFRIEASAKDPDGPGNLALIFNFMKMLDPNSVVRESEFATAENTGSLPDVMWVKLQKLATGKRLSPTQQRNFVNRAKMLYESANRGHKISAKSYEGIAKNRGLDIRNITLPLGEGEKEDPIDAMEIPDKLKAEARRAIKSGKSKAGVMKKLQQMFPQQSPNPQGPQSMGQPQPQNPEVAQAPAGSPLAQQRGPGILGRM